MLNDYALELAGLGLLILASAFFSGSESAVVSISRLHARAMQERQVKGSEALLQLLEDRNRFLTTILICNTLVLLGADSLATVVFIHAGVPNAPVWSTLIMATLLLLFGEIIPKTVAIANNEPWATRVGPMLQRITWIMTPVTLAFLAMTNLFVRLLGIRPDGKGPFVTEDDIRNIVNVGAEQKVLEEQEREMIHSVIEFGDTVVREVMTPRPDMVAINITEAPRRALDLVIAEGYSKIPVFEETIDNVVGVVLDRELLIDLSNGTLATASMRSLMRPVAHVPETKRVSELLREMQRGKYSLAIVVDEYGGTAGLVTMEDLLEEIVGEIRDEHDEGEEEPIHIVAPGEAIVQAGTNVGDVNEALDIELPEEEYDTIGGLAVGLFGRLPSEGEEVFAGEHVRLRIDRTRGKRILAVRVYTNGKAAPSDVFVAEPEEQGVRG
jgi:CBS domain containing-hemolysin-like protein